MYAFIPTEAGLFKIYARGDDWQVIGPNNFERWFSAWRANYSASLARVVGCIPGADPADLVICE